jgi:hypothetical protein
MTRNRAVVLALTLSRPPGRRRSGGQSPPGGNGDRQRHDAIS